MEINISSLTGGGADMTDKDTPEQSHWLLNTVSVILVMLALSWLGAWIAEELK